MTERRRTDTEAGDYMAVRELNGHFGWIHAKLEDIHLQTKSTNGRVNNLESWRDKLIGATATLTVLVVPMLIYIAKQWLTHINLIEGSVIDWAIRLACGA